jgi:hypothetical protein
LINFRGFGYDVLGCAGEEVCELVGSSKWTGVVAQIQSGWQAAFLQEPLQEWPLSLPLLSKATFLHQWDLLYAVWIDPQT